MSYGLHSYEEFDALYDLHDGDCHICSDPLERDGKNTHVDHCHDSGRIRGLLCQRCNQGLGHFRDNPSLLEAAVKYLQKS